MILYCTLLFTVVSFAIIVSNKVFPFFFSTGERKDPNLLAHWKKGFNITFLMSLFIIHQTQYQISDWSRAFNQFTIACELDMINAISAADIAFIMSSSTSAWLLSPLECSPQKQNG